MIRTMLLAACAVLLAGCAGSRCLGDQPYAHAPSVPPLQPVEGLKLPDSSAALKIPPPPANPTPFGQKVTSEKGKEAVECLDQPPRMPRSADEPPADVKPAEKKSPG